MPGGEQPAQRIGERECHALPVAAVKFRAVGIGRFLKMFERPEPQLHCGRQRAGAGLRARRTDGAHLSDPRPVLREEQLVCHRDRELPALDGFGAFVSGFELGVHPFVTEEPGAIFRDAVATH